MRPPKRVALELQSVIDSHANPFVLVDEHYTIVAANKAYCDAYGTPREEVIGCKCHRVSHHFDSPCFEHNEQCPLSTVLKTEQIYEVLHIHFDHNNHPEHVRVKGHPIIGSDGRRYVGEEIIRLARTAELDCEGQTLIGSSKAFRECIEGLTRIATMETNILLHGEKGVGKHLAAQYLHRRSPRAGRPFVQIDCRRSDEALFERELFGHERGAYAGCVGRRHGLLDEADGGTLFLNEVAEIPMSAQGRLASVLETGLFRRVGGKDVIKTQLRVISSTTKPLRALVEAGKFRADLYYCLSEVTTRIPPLRERREDITALADALLIRICSPTKQHCHIKEDAQEKLKNYDFPGNMAELHNILQKSVSLSGDGIIRSEHIRLDESVSERPLATEVTPPDDAPSLKALEAEHIGRLLRRHNGHRRHVADELGITERTLYRKLKAYGLCDIGQT